MDSQSLSVIGTICDAGTKNNCREIKLEIPYQQLSDIDYSFFAQYWGVAFTSVVALYLFSHCIGLIIKFVRNA